MRENVWIFSLYLHYLLYSLNLSRNTVIMDLRATPLYPDFQILRPLDAFKPPPCQPPKGKDVLERFFHVLNAQPKNRRDKAAAAHTVATKLIDLWKLGDGRIPLLCCKTLQKNILDFRADLAFLCTKANHKKPVYANKVRNSFFFREKKKQKAKRESTKIL